MVAAREEGVMAAEVVCRAEDVKVAGELGTGSMEVAEKGLEVVETEKAVA